MDKDTRNAIDRATQRARKLLEEDFSTQLEGDFDVHRSGAVAVRAGSHLPVRRVFQRDRIVAAIEHKRAAGMGAPEAVADYLRDAAFTTLNRLVALKMLEARGLVQECITKGEQSSGYREFCGLAPGLSLLQNSAGYQLYIESLFDELSTEVKVLFDRRDPSSVLWPKRSTFEQVLEILSAGELAGAWGEDETIGWVYQFFNGADERRKMRDESPAPRNSRELAVRNQFFTPRYLVQFLTDNTLGRIWYEMRGTKTVLAERCEYMVRTPAEEVTPRPKKDPRDLHILDPACGSGHFLLYAFDLLLTIYEEAYADPEAPSYDATGRALREDYASLEALRRVAPALILAHNLHGVDIDPRCAQTAEFALWMRAQRAYRDIGLARADRPQIRRSNIVVAEPLVADDRLSTEFIACLDDADLGGVFKGLVVALKLAGELGILARFEALVGRSTSSGHTGDLFAPQEERIRAALKRFVTEEGARVSTRKRLFAEDAAQGIGLLAIAEKKFDVVLMNPPFGEPTEQSSDYISHRYPDWNKNILCAFVGRAKELSATGGLCGAVVDRTINEKSTYEKFRRRYLLGEDFALHEVADLGWGVLDANVEVSALVVGQAGADHEFRGLDARDDADKAEALRGTSNWVSMSIRSAKRLPNCVIGYFFPSYAIRLFDTLPSLRDAGFDFFEGHTLKSDRYFRLSWECAKSGTDYWQPLFNGTSYSRFAYPHHDVVAMAAESGVVADRGTVLRNASKQKRPGVCFGKRGEFVDAQLLPPGFVSTVEGKACLTPSDDDAWALLALMNSQLFQAIINLYTGQHKYSGYVELIPYPGTMKLGRAAERARAIVDEKWRLWSHVELAPNFKGLHGFAPEELAQDLLHAMSRIEDLEAALNEAVFEAYGLLHDREAKTHVRQACASEPRSLDPFCSADRMHCAERCVQFAIGQAFGRFPAASSSEPLGFHETAVGGATSGADILDDDLGRIGDICERVTTFLRDRVAQLCAALNAGGLRGYIATKAFAFHTTYYSRSGRSGPIYWQLATSSGSYSVWLYIHAFTNDTLFRVQNDYVTVKLAHEERRLEAMRRERRENPSAPERRELDAQVAFVEELRLFLDEVKRVAPLWKPYLNDGVVINFAPLWRLVPQHKPWQKELKATWDALCNGDYDWAHLAMHLWPERVIHKCATDRSLAIVHGLEDTFWVEVGEGKWAARKKSTRPIEELVREATSVAVKAALRSLLEAPLAAGNGDGGRRRAVANAKIGGGH